MTAGVLMLLFLAWQLWWNDAISASSQSKAANEASRELSAASATPSTPAQPSPTASETVAPTPIAPAPLDPPVLGPVENGEAFGVMFVPRFGENSQRQIAGGVGTDVLNSMRLGVGHYPGTAMPGDLGNFAIAAHRSAYGGGMYEINQLRLGDAIYVQTEQGWYTYRFRNLEYVTADQIAVLNPVPQTDVSANGSRIITLTSCNPLYSTAERIIAYGVLESFQPADAGPPAEIAAQVAAWAS